MAYARTHRSAGERTDLYEQITNRIIAELEAGRAPWVQPWGSSKVSIGMPYNAVRDRRYSGINVLTLWDAIVSRGFASHAFLTFRQALALGGHVRRGEQGVGVGVSGARHQRNSHILGWSGTGDGRHRQKT
ncbi:MULTISPECIES: ArdC-like ssDNA-binding domain-containing protein [Sphingobium]|uniref:N-terminal domain-containing protein n=1 Tax=Sphingobium fuliginis (strain ATCC 27551) TaxID=336203 RepID=A0ABQ1ELH4_SPHSA|nr:DUF1738 domain-containing protein [Sphingobium fuliginis]GFZ76496.1 hypothetical protein GCM10019071_00930 [Sphingobium fuliginis]